MSKVADGVKYDFAEKVAEKYEYSVFHIRHLARTYKKGDRIKGLKGFKDRGRWVISLADADKKLKTVDVDSMESVSKYESRQKAQSIGIGNFRDPKDSWLDEL